MIFHINHEPLTPGFDLVDRIKRGVGMAAAERIDWCFVIENDDFYPVDYFDQFLPFMKESDFMGDDHTTYYNLQNCTYRTFDHPYRSSLFTTAFRISALNNFDWPTNDKPFLDIDIWKYARHKRRKFIDSGALGIKHGLGLCGGKGHYMRAKHEDFGLSWLQRHTDEIGFEFYSRMIEKLKAKV